MEIKSLSDLYGWMDEAESHARSDLGFYIQVSEKTGLHDFGSGHGNFICSGSLDIPEDTRGTGTAAKEGTYLPAGFCHNLKCEPMNQEKITEDVTLPRFRPVG